MTNREKKADLITQLMAIAAAEPVVKISDPGMAGEEIQEASEWQMDAVLSGRERPGGGTGSPQHY